MKKIILSLSLICIMSIGKLFCESQNHYISICLEGFGSSIAGGLNIEYSPNRNLDFGFGIMPAKFPIPYEMHAYLRYNLLSTSISPFFELSSLVMLWEDGNTDKAASRIHVGMLARLTSGLYFGISLGYQILGNDFLFIDNLGRVIPGVFVGWRFRSE